MVSAKKKSIQQKNTELRFGSLSQLIGLRASERWQEELSANGSAYPGRPLLSVGARLQVAAATQN